MGGGGKGIPYFLAVRGFPDLGAPIPSLLSGKPRVQGRRETKLNSTPAVRARPRFLGFWRFSFGCRFPF